MTEKKEQFNDMETISFESEIRIRFNETDPLGIVWHGNYITYFEDGREAFGRKFGISYLDIKEKGYAIPIVKSSCEHKRPLRYGEVAKIKTIFVNSPAAKIIFKYKIFDATNKLACIGETVQVFVNDCGRGELALTLPKFFEDWKRKVGLLN